MFLWAFGWSAPVFPLFLMEKMIRHRDGKGRHGRIEVRRESKGRLRHKMPPDGNSIALSIPQNLTNNYAYLILRRVFCSSKDQRYQQAFPLNSRAYMGSIGETCSV